MCQSRAGSSGGFGGCSLCLSVSPPWARGSQRGVGLPSCLLVPCVSEGFAEQDVFLPCPEQRHWDRFIPKSQPSLTLLFPPFSSQGCAANFSSLMGYQYHQKRCGKQLAEADKPIFSCPHCGKKYKSKAGHDYHVRSEHPASVSPPDTSAARGTGPALPVGDCRAAEPVGRTEPGRAGPGKAGADVGLMLFSPFSSPHACVVPCSVGGERATAPFCPSPKSRELCLSEGSGGRCSPAPAGLPSCAPAKKNKRSDHSSSSQQAACHHWGGRMRPWGASSVLLIPPDSASDSNNPITLINGDVYTRGKSGSRKGHD